MFSESNSTRVVSGSYAKQFREREKRSRGVEIESLIIMSDTNLHAPGVAARTIIQALPINRGVKVEIPGVKFPAMSKEA